MIEAAKLGDEQAMEALIVPHMPLLRSLAARFDYLYVTAEDLIQAGYLGFIQAIRHYDAAKETALTTYAVPWILGEMRRQIRMSISQAVVLSLDQEQSEEETGSLIDKIRSEDVIDEERIDLSQALRSLPEEEQLVICLRYYRDKTQIETAELLRRSQTQISRIERRAIDRLHACLSSG